MHSETQGSTPEASTSVVTGAFGFSGQQIAKRLLLRGEKVRTLTNHPQPGSPLFGRVQVSPLDFADTKQMTESMRGASVVYNTYWVRFSYGGFSHERAVQNTKALIHAAEAAGVKRIVHVSITNPSIDSPLPYFKGKAELEHAIRSSSLSYAILRPAVLFGEGDILINNIAFMLKRFPLFAIPGSGEYHVQPIFVNDVAELAVDGGHRSDSYTVDAVGPGELRVHRPGEDDQERRRKQVVVDSSSSSIHTACLWSLGGHPQGRRPYRRRDQRTYG